METFGILENWLLLRGGPLQKVVATRGSTVCYSLDSDLSSG